MNGVDDKQLGAYEPVAYLEGVGLGRQRACVISALWGLEDTYERPTRLLFAERGGFQHVDIDLNIRSVCPLPGANPPQVVALHEFGSAFVGGPAGLTQEAICDPGQGSLLRVRDVAQAVYACGMRGQVYQRRAGRWRRCDQGLFDPDPRTDMIQLRDIHGVRENSLYTVGLSGVIAYFDGKVWRRLESPTNFHLEQVVAVADDDVWICGDHGLLLHGNTAGWRVIETGAKAFWGLSWFQGRLYVSGLDELWTFDDQQGLQSVDTGAIREPSVYRLHATQDELWVIGTGDILRFDGRAWERLRYPGNDAPAI
jgi:hypothetical protein